MSKLAGYCVAWLSRHFPVETGRWRIGKLAYDLLGTSGLDGIVKTVRTRHGFVMELALSEFVDRTIYCTGEWEPWETKIIVDTLKPGGHFVDVGANIGYFTLLAASIVGKQGKIFSFECNPDTVEVLKRNIALNGFATIMLTEAAVGEAPGTASIASREIGNRGGDFVRFSEDGTNRFDGGDDAAAADNQRHIQVPVLRVDTVLDDIQIDMIKVDIEGAEAKALRGMTGLFSAPRSLPDIIFEITPDYIRAAGDDPKAMLDMLKGHGYTIYRTDADIPVEIGDEALTQKQSYCLARA